MDTDRVLYLNLLYDCYKELFTEKQQKYFEEYYWDDLSLSEIAENNDVSRNAIHNQLKIMEERLIELEDKLGLNKKKNEIIKILENKVDDTTLEIIKGLL
ncbi:MAG: HTH domain-containing protein [Bacilli bacterium]|nr:HTH domain-containing protein [Bacilli bacterium]